VLNQTSLVVLQAKHGGGKNFGFVAQDVKPVLSEIVSVHALSEGTQAHFLRLTDLIALLTQAYQDRSRTIQKQQGEIDRLRSDVATLSRRLREREACTELLTRMDSLDQRLKALERSRRPPEPRLSHENEWPR